MKTISFVIPCYNEKENVAPLCEELLTILKTELAQYDYEILFIDNHSKDGTQDVLRELVRKQNGVRAIFNVRNFGAYNSPAYGLLQSRGDCAVLLAADFQEPVAAIPEFVKKWEEGAQVVAGVRKGSRENPLKYAFRTLYYKLMGAGSHLEYIDHFTGFGLYDRTFLEVLRAVDDPMPFIRGMVAEFGARIERVYYDQPKRRAGTTHHSFLDLYDAAMLSFTSYTSLGLRIITIFGFIASILSFVIGMIYLVQKLLRWDTFHAGIAPLMVGIFFLGAVLLVTIGLIGEYTISINRRIMRRPLVVEEERIGFEPEDER